MATKAERDPEKALTELRQTLETLQKKLEREAQKRDRESGRLRDEEQAVARAAAALSTTRKQLAGSRERRSQLLAEQAKHRQRLESEQESLAAHVRAAYMGGRQERLRLALNQQDPARLGRLMVYYRYVSDTRARQIHGVKAELERLAAIDADIVSETRKLEDLQARRVSELEALRSARDRRSTIVATLNAGIERRGDQISRLKAEEAALEKLVEELRQALVNMPGVSRDPFADQRGKLVWPVTGNLLSDFGQPRAGGSLRWNGVLVGTSRGAEVRAVYHGRVAYANWLPGLGLLLVLEHGDGYMSLYGHNEVLFKQVGDWVAPGEVIAEVGDSGGRSRAALYFEIRKGAQPQDPHRWFRKRLSSR